MADFTTANLPGANKFFNAARDKFSTMKDTLKSNMEVDASTLTATLKSDLLDFGDKLKAMIPELPDLPDINLQAELTSLQSLAGLSRATALASLKSKFGSGLSAQGVELNDLVSKATDAFGAGKKISAEIPNFTIPVAGGDVVEKAKEVLQADKDDVKEIPSDEVKTEVTEEIKKVAIDGLEKKKTLVTYSKVEKVTTTGGGSKTVISENSVEPQGYIVKEEPEKDTVDTTAEAPATPKISKAERMGLSEADYQRYKELKSEGHKLSKATRPASDDRPAGPLAENTDALERKEKVQEERKALFQKGRKKKQVAKLEASGLSRKQALSITSASAQIQDR